MHHIIIGTAGHVDHGKTALVKALTGIETDRLKEEKERGISIELGFAYLDLGPWRLGLVDVPGHERFIKNMLAGAGGMDMVMLVIAADEGIMPQTREHLDIIQLLHVKKGLVVLTKVDLVDREWLEMVKDDIEQYLQGTMLEGAPIIETSAVTGYGLDRLKQVLRQMAEDIEKRNNTGPCYLPVDRVFSVTGFGTVVTGTMRSGTVTVGEEVVVLPAGLKSRVRSLQVHGKKVEVAVAGQRVAVNLTALDTTDVPRGSVVAAPGFLQPSYRMDVRLELLGSAKPLKHRSRVRFYLGTAEILGRVILLDREELQPGAVCYASVELENEAVAARGDRFVIRSYSPMHTIGGGTVIEPCAVKHRRYKKETLAELQVKEQGSPMEIISQTLKQKATLLTSAEIVRITGLALTTVEEVLRGADGENAVILLENEGEQYWVDRQLFAHWGHETRNLCEQYHSQYPLRPGVPKEDLHSRKFAFLNQKQWQALLAGLAMDNYIKVVASYIASPTFVPTPSDYLVQKIDALLKKYIESACQPPDFLQAAHMAGISPQQAEEVLGYLLRQGALVKVADGMYFHQQVLDDARNKLVEYLQQKDQISVGEARDILATSRKYALPLLDYFDKQKITKRVGDLRVLAKK
ncbi:MAG: selenocysteine-specific translation elongation factor [Bacillota bacterium]|uniref:selenocysteine-specific translation elongation factor n=1 Tax=Desulfurispora thermophila TaxID=265470 RepID=UPI00036FDECB|nr:selenocysteine-specific translation elongation factor [Desulfurispora thermophila]